MTKEEQARKKAEKEAVSRVMIGSVWWILDSIWEVPREVKVIRTQSGEDGFLCWDTEETEARGPKGKHYLHQVFNKSSLFPSLDALCDYYIDKFKKFKNKRDRKMKLEEGIYEIPDDCTAVYQNRKVIIKKMKAVDRPKVPHCGDCIHQKLGRKSLRNQYYDSPYCENKPKTIDGKLGYFYNASSYKKACEQFSPRNNETT